jgi:hypothetical protein
VKSLRVAIRAGEGRSAFDGRGVNPNRHADKPLAWSRCAAFRRETTGEGKMICAMFGSWHITSIPGLIGMAAIEG